MPSMSHPLLRLLGLVVLLAIVLPAIDCSPADIHYTPEDDDAAMALVVGAKSAEGITLTLCEDDARASSEQATRDNGCIIDHIARDSGEGFAETHQRPSGLGCGGCLFDVTAFVTARFDAPGLEAPLELSGDVVLGSLWDDDPYATPYHVTLQSADGQIWIYGPIDAHGALSVTDAKLPVALGALPTLPAQDAPGACAALAR